MHTLILLEILSIIKYLLIITHYVYARSMYTYLLKQTAKVSRHSLKSGWSIVLRAFMLPFVCKWIEHMKAHLQWGTGELERKGGTGCGGLQNTAPRRDTTSRCCRASVMDDSQVRAPGHACSLVSLQRLPRRCAKHAIPLWSGAWL